MFAVLLKIIMIVSWAVLIWAIVLMSPKWWIWMGIWWASGGSNEYGSKKSLEWKLKNIAIICAVLFVVSSIILPYAIIG